MANPVARAEMLIRRPANELFAAFVEPEKLKRFWLSDASGPLAHGRTVHWDFMVPGVSDEVTVTGFVEGRQLELQFSDGSKADISFEEILTEQTRVAVRNWDFPDDPVESAIEASQGFSIVLCDLKSVMETGMSGGFVADKAALIQRKMS